VICGRELAGKVLGEGRDAGIAVTHASNVHRKSPIRSAAPPKAAIAVSTKLNGRIRTFAPIQADPLPAAVMVASTPCTAARWRDASRRHVQ
jgi:hypothetical protein